MRYGKLDISTLEDWLWEAACSIRGQIDAPKYKDYIIPLIFYKRLCDVYEDEIRKLAEEFESEEIAKKLVAKDRKLIKVLHSRRLSLEKYKKGYN